MRTSPTFEKLSVFLVLLAFFLPATATELTFDYDFRDRESVDPAYGDFVEDVVQGEFSYGDAGGFTPRVMLSYGPAAADPSLFGTGFGDLVNVLFKDADNFDTMDITLQATPGSSVRLRGFDLAASDRTFQDPEATIRSIQILDGEGNVLFERTLGNPADLAHLAIPTAGHKHYGSACAEDQSDPSCAYFPVLEAQQLTIRFDSGNLGRDSDGIGIDNIRFSQGRPPGLFSKQNIIGGAAWARSIAAADLDGDGDVDVLVAAETDRKLAWHENLDGKGTFGDERLICACFDNDSDGVCDNGPVCDLPEDLDFTSVAACDLDEDGDLDIVAGSDGISQEIVWYPNDGAGNFSPRGGCNPAVSGEGSCQVALDGSVDVVCADLARTGTTDVVSAGFGSRVIWVPNDGSGNFAEPVDVDTANALETIKIGDFDRDGLDDVWEGGFSQLVVVENRLDQPNSGFTARPNIASGSENIRALDVDDVDGDGDLDMVVAGHDCSGCPEGFVAVFLNDGAGDFSRQPDLARGDLAETVFFGDVDRDGDLDVLVGSDDEISWIENAGGATFTTQRVISGLSGGTEEIIEADIDGDGDPDMVAAAFEDGQVTWHANKMIHRSALFPAETDVGPAAQQNADPRTVALTDVDGDGDADAIIGTGPGLPNELRRNDGDGDPWDNSALEFITGDTDDTVALVLGDVNRDAWTDLVTGNADGSIKLYLNDADGSPWDTLGGGIPLAASAGATTSLALADLNGDGALDIVAGKSGQNVVYLSTGATGAGTDPFAGVAATPLGTEMDDTNSVAIVDADKDGAADVVAGNSAAVDRLYVNDGNGGFAAAGLPIGGAGAPATDTRSVAIGDFDRDGGPDLLVGTRGGENLLYINDRVGDPWDAPGHPLAPDADDTAAVAIGDLDADGDVDVVLANDGQGDLFHLNGNGGTFAAAAALGSFQDSTRAVALGDADRDGDLDALIVVPARGVLYVENRGGHYGFTTTDIAPQYAFEGETTPMLCVVLEMNGRPGDSVGQLISIDFQFEDLNVTNAAALADRLEIYRDIQGECKHDPLDPLVFSANNAALAGPTLTASFPDVPDARVAGPATFLVALSLKPGAVQGEPELGQPKTVRVKHFGGMGLVREANAGVELIAEPSADVVSAQTTVLDPIMVDETEDVPDTPGTSLREAIEQANASGDNSGRPDRIVLQPDTTYTLALPEDGGVPLEIEEIVVTDFTEIVGGGMGSTIIDAGCADGPADCLDRVFSVVTTGNLTLKDLTIVGGDGSGAAILNDGGRVTLVKVEITQNYAGASDAPLVNSNGGQLAIHGSHVQGNEGLSAGCLINDSSSTLEIDSTTLANNAGSVAGCVLNEGAATVASSTFSGNVTLGNGGAIHNAAGATLDLSSATLALNAALMEGGAVFNSGTLSTNNSILTNNAGFQSGPDCSGTIDSLGYNVISNTMDCGLNPPAGSMGDQLDVDPRILPLQDNGGSTPTHALLPSSPAIDQGSCPGATEDQRASDRPLDVPGFPLSGDPGSVDGCDVGAAEMNLDTLLSRLRIPVRWCVLSGTDLAADQQTANDTLDDWLQDVSDEIFKPRAGTVLFPAASINARDWVIVPDPSTEIGREGQVFVDPDRLDFDEFHHVNASCRAAWEQLEPDVTGLTAVAIGAFVDGNGDRLPLKGIGGRAQCFDVAAQTTAGRVMVVEDTEDALRNHVLGHEFGHALCLEHGDGIDDDGDGDPNDADDAFAEKPLLDGPNLMQYRGGDELTLLQAFLAREHAALTIPDLKSTPPTQIAGSTDGFDIESRNAQLLDFGILDLFDFRDSVLLDFRDSVLLDFRDAVLLDFRDSVLLDFRESQLLDFRDSVLLDFRDSVLLDFRDSVLLDFSWLDVAEFGAAYDPATTTFYSSTTEAALPPALLPETGYYWYADLDTDPNTGGTPSDHGFPLGTDQDLDGDSDETGIDLITKAVLSSTCDAEIETCQDFVELSVYDWAGTAFVEMLRCMDNTADGVCDVVTSCVMSNSVDCDLDPALISADFDSISVALVQEGGDSEFISEERKTQGLKIGFSLPSPLLELLLGEALPAVPQFRLEVLTEVECSTDPDNPSVLPNGRVYACVCMDSNQDGTIDCSDCPDDPGCLAGDTPTPAPVVPTSKLEADFGVDTIVFRPAQLPACEIVPDAGGATGPGSRVTVNASLLPAGETIRVTTRDGETLMLAGGGEAIGSTDLGGEASLADVLIPANVNAGEFEAQVRIYDPATGADQDAIRASCFVTLEGGCVDSDDDGVCDLDDVCPSVPDPGNDADGDGFCAPDDNCPAVPNDQTNTDGDAEGDACDTDDDNDGVDDGTDTAALDPSVCADADLDGCDDCAVGTDGLGPLSDNDPANDGTDYDADGLCDAGDADDDNDGALDPADSDDNNPNVCSDVDNDTCDDCSSGTFNPANDGADLEGDGLCNIGDPDDDNDGVLDAADPNDLNPNVCGDSDADGCDDCSVGVDGFGPLPDINPANDGPDADADGVCDAGDNCLAASNPDQSDADGDNIGDACEPTVTVFKQVINDHGGTLDPEDFTIDVAGTVNGAAVPSFRGDAGGTTIELDPGAYGVTENPIYADFYAATLSADCAGVIAIGDAKTCTIVNDDLDREQTSSRVESLSATLSDSGAGIRDVVSGEFVMTDQSSGAASLTLLLSHYEVDFQFKRRGSFEPADSVADTFDVNGTTVSYSCEYNIVSDLPGATDLYQSGDPVEFDETITVGYTCTLDNSLPNKGTLKVTGAGEIFGRPDFQYTLSPTFSVGPGGLD